MFFNNFLTYDNQIIIVLVIVLYLLVKINKENFENIITLNGASEFDLLFRIFINKSK